MSTRQVMRCFNLVLFFVILFGVFTVNAQMENIYTESDFYENLSCFENYNEVPQLRDVDPEILTILKNSKGEFSPILRNAFLKKAKDIALDSLQSLGKQVDQNMLSWLDSDTMAYDAVYGSISPVDPDILLNLNQLWKELGAEFTKKYKNLTLSAAIARKGFGVDSLPGNFGWWGHDYREMKKVQEKGQIYTEYKWEQDANAQTPYVPKSSADTIAYNKVKELLTAEKLTYRQAYDDIIARAKVDGILAANGSKSSAYDCLSGLLMLNSTQLPWKRTMHPKVSDYIKFLVNIVEIPASTLPLENKQKWPYFPTLTAPWPLMMPLARTLPLDECQFIWDKYLGKHGNKRLHLYGPYRSKTRPYKLVDRPWHWTAYPALIEIGGVCGTMSTISQRAQTALGRPVLKAGQPGHSCTVTYGCNELGEFSTGIGQSISSPEKTHTFWFFADGDAWDLENSSSNGVHQFGLGLAMNFKLSQYMDTRIALHIYKILSQKQKDSLGYSLLFSTLKKNPYNTEVFYTIVKDTRDAASLLAVMDTVHARITDNSFAPKIEKNINNYIKFTMKAILRNAFVTPNNFTPEDQLLISNYLDPIKNMYEPESLIAYNIFKRKFIPWEQVSIKSAPDTINMVEKIIDNDLNTKWLLKKKFPIEIVLKANTSYEISGFLYYTRREKMSGRVKDYLIFVSDDGVNWGDTIVSSEWEKGNTPQYVFFEPVKGKFLKYVALSSHSNDTAIGIREIKILYTPSNVTGISSKDALQHTSIPMVTSIKNSRGIKLILSSDAVKSSPCKIYNIQGKLIRTILPVKAKGRVSYTVKREGLAQQVYIVKIDLGNCSFVQKVLF